MPFSTLVILSAPHSIVSAHVFAHPGTLCRIGTAGLERDRPAVCVETLVPSPGSTWREGFVRTAGLSRTGRGRLTAGAKPEDVVSPMRVIVSV